MAKLLEAQIHEEPSFELHSPLPKSFKVCKERTMEKRKSKQSEEKQRDTAAVFHCTFGALPKSIFYILYTISKLRKSRIQRFSKYGCYVMAWMQSHGNFSHRKLLDFYPLVISYELLEGEVFNSKFCINPLEPISMAIESYEHLVEECPTIPGGEGMFGTIQISHGNHSPSRPTTCSSNSEASNLEQAMVNLSKVVEDFSLLNKRMDEVQNDLSQKIDNLQHSISRLTNLKAHKGESSMVKEVKMVITLSSKENETEKKKREEIKGKRKRIVSIAIIQCKSLMKDANFIWDPGKRKCKMMKEKEEKREFWPLVVLSLSGHIWSTSSSPFYTYYIPFRSSELWSLEENWTELSGNFAHLNRRCENFRTVRNSSWHTSVISHTQANFRTVRIKVRKFRTPLFKVRNSFQGAKISSKVISFAHLNPRCENFRTVRIKVRNHLLAHECHFAHLKPLFAPCETRCESRCHFAHHNSRCEILILRCENFATVGHDFGALPGAQIMHMICRFKAWEVRNPVLQTVSDLDLKRRSYGCLKADYAK
ncbi:hypothetical protein AAG906_025029 [Vitis piasezkii]